MISYHEPLTVIYLNDIRVSMSLRALNHYLYTRILYETEHRTNIDILAQQFAIVCTLGHAEYTAPTETARKRIYGEIVEDKRTARQIVDDVFKKHNLTLKEE